MGLTVRLLRLACFLLLVLAAPDHAQDREGHVTADDGTRLFYRIEGDGPQTLVVVHGGPGNSMESVRPDFGPLARGRRVIYYDQRGNGRSQLIEDESRLSFEHHIADLDPVRRQFGLERLTLLGNSWGGAAGLRPGARRVMAPVLVIHGETDAIPVEGAQDSAESYPNARLLLVPRTGHLIHLEQPDIFFAAVEVFLGGDWPVDAR